MNRTADAAPRLSIGLPVYNGERFLGETLSCLLGQTFADFELIVTDNASNDGTEDICRTLAARDPRVRYVRNARDLGAIENFNHALVLGRAPFFKWAAHDDLYAPTYLAACFDILDANPHVILAHSDTAFIGEDGRTFDWNAARHAYIDPYNGSRQHPDDPDIGTDPAPTRRFWQVLQGALWGTHMFGVMRREALTKTRLLQNFVSSDRAMLAELALLGAFQTNHERLFMKRFHRTVSWTLDQRALKNFLSTTDTDYSRRARQLSAFWSAPSGKPITSREMAVCRAMVAVHSAKTIGNVLTMKDARQAAKARVWRKEKPLPS